jgi:hypothetical protein
MTRPVEGARVVKALRAWLAQEAPPQGEPAAPAAPRREAQRGQPAGDAAPMIG